MTMESATTRDVAVPSRTGGRHYADALLHVAALSLVAGGIHAVAAPPHFAESLSRGVFFAALAAFQLAWGTLIYSRPSGRGFQLGAVVSVGVIALWAISRTAGVPFGPAAWQAEAVGPLDLAATASDALIIALAARLLSTGLRASA